MFFYLPAWQMEQQKKTHKTGEMEERTTCGCACTVQVQTLIGVMMQPLSRPTVSGRRLVPACVSFDLNLQPVNCKSILNHDDKWTGTTAMNDSKLQEIKCPNNTLHGSIYCLYFRPATLCRVLFPVQKKYDFIAKLGLRLNWSTWGKVSFLILFPEDTAEWGFLASTVTSQFETDAFFH